MSFACGGMFLNPLVVVFLVFDAGHVFVRHKPASFLLNHICSVRFELCSWNCLPLLHYHWGLWLWNFYFSELLWQSSFLEELLPSVLSWLGSFRQQPSPLRHFLSKSSPSKLCSFELWCLNSCYSVLLY